MKRHGIQLALFFILLSAVSSVFATPPKTLKVAYFYHGIYMNKSADGVYDGFDVDFLYEISKYTGWNYKFEEYSSFEAALEATKEGKADVILDILYSGERAGKLLFSTETVGKQYITLLVRNDDTTHLYGDYRSFAGKRIGALAGWLDTESFRQYDNAKKLHTKVTEVQTIDELFALLDAKKVDAVAISDIGPSEKYRTVLTFDPMYTYIAMPRKNAPLMEELNTAMNEIAMNRPEFRSTLNRKYFSAHNVRSILFTNEEKEYIGKTKTITVAMGDSNPPFSYLDASGKMRGAVPDMLKYFSKLSGLNFVSKGIPTPKEAEDALRNGEVQAIAKLTENQPLMASRGIHLTDHYMELPLNEITRKGTTIVKKVAIPEEIGIVYRNASEGDRPLANLDVHYLPTVHDCFRALHRGEVDAVFCDNISASYLLNHSRVSEFAVSTLNGYSYPIALGVEISSDAELLSILNKCVQYTKHFTLNDLLQKYSLEEDPSAFAFINRIPTKIIGIYTFILSFAIIALIGLIFLLRKHAHKERELIAEREKVKQEAKLSAERTEFFGTVSHDMRTPLNGILGYADIALERNKDESLRGYLEKIKISGKIMLDLVNDTLIIAKTENKNFKSHLEIVSTDTLLESVIVPIKSLAERKRIAFTIKAFPSYNGYIKADRLNIQKILLNLLTNAMKFTPENGTVSFDIDIVDLPQDKSYCKAIVSDNGIGMDKDFIPKMFEPFSQENADKGNQNGSGLGLSIVRLLVDALKGNISVHTKKGKGTEFTVFIPINKISNYRTPDEKIFPDISLISKKILLCEDNEMNREIAKMLLQKYGMDVSCAINGEEGVETFQRSGKGEFAAILMDIRMPVMNGYEATAAIRSLDRSDAKTVPIIALSADAYDEDVHKAKDAGMNAHLAKPIDPGLLCETLSKEIAKAAVT